jgi:hypothetical protein
LFLPIIAYTLSSTKLEIRAKEFLLGIEGVRERVGRNEPNIVCKIWIKEKRGKKRISDIL